MIIEIGLSVFFSDFDKKDSRKIIDVENFGKLPVTSSLKKVETWRATSLQ